MVWCPAAANAKLLAGTGTMRMRPRGARACGPRDSLNWTRSRGATIWPMEQPMEQPKGTAMNGEAGLALAGLASRSDAARLGSVTVRSSRASLTLCDDAHNVTSSVNHMIVY